jgi:hypothetical protein
LDFSFEFFALWIATARSAFFTGIATSLTVGSKVMEFSASELCKPSMEKCV